MGKAYLRWFKLGFIAGLVFAVGFTIIMLNQESTLNRDPLLISFAVILSSLGVGIHVGFVGLIIHLIRTRSRRDKKTGSI